ncbi:MULTISPECIES: hypothetical protein [Burkholderia]|uniref:hypothetical protein n=1 Tax=Burkholderia TaxID=32008 RepID=UPI001908C0E1|nr:MULTISPECIES: hypothetical protein [Burkholderia]MBK1820695.1 hypothetical protein [Burkholderia orbicola]MBR8322700.1 hypothetical protein [Burkholderia cenocepacia]MBR8399963.1 hypothetical protein [Burkholderia cenocepacia]
MSLHQNHPQPKNGISISVGAAVTGGITLLVAVASALGVTYTQGVQYGKDSAHSECRAAIDDLDSTKKKLTDTQASLDVTIKNLISWREAYEGSQRAIADQASQIAVLNGRVKASNQCDFLRQQFDYYQTQLNLNNWSADSPRREELMTGRRELLARMESCTRL